MNGRPDLAEMLADALRPLLAELVHEQVTAVVDERLRERDGHEYVTTAEYAARFRSTPGAVLARIRRGTLKAVRPPGSRVWLIPVDEGEAGRNRNR